MVPFHSFPMFVYIPLLWVKECLARVFQINSMKLLAFRDCLAFFRRFVLFVFFFFFPSRYLISFFFLSSIRYFTCWCYYDEACLGVLLPLRCGAPFFFFTFWSLLIPTWLSVRTWCTTFPTRTNIQICAHLHTRVRIYVHLHMYWFCVQINMCRCYHRSFFFFVININIDINIIYIAGNSITIFLSFVKYLPPFRIRFFFFKKILYHPTQFLYFSTVAQLE